MVGKRSGHCPLFSICGDPTKYLRVAQSTLPEGAISSLSPETIKGSISRTLFPYRIKAKWVASCSVRRRACSPQTSRAFGGSLLRSLKYTDILVDGHEIAVSLRVQGATIDPPLKQNESGQLPLSLCVPESLRTNFVFSTNARFQAGGGVLLEPQEARQPDGKTCLILLTGAVMPTDLQGSAVLVEDVPVPIASRQDFFKEFDRRLKGALETRDPVMIKALYWKGVAGTLDVKGDVQRLERIFKEETETRMSVYFKDLSKLPPNAREVWGEQARLLTEHDATHLAFILYGNRVRLMLPLIVSGDRLLIAPSGKVD